MDAAAAAPGMPASRAPAPEAPAFDAPDLHARLDALDDAGLDALPFGVVRMDRDGTVTGYNAAERRLSGLGPDRVLGRHFFTGVAPCTDNAVVAGRFAEEALDASLPYVFTMRMRATPVTLRLLGSRASPHRYLVVGPPR
jgi:photoactive yellow protein